MKIEAVTKYGGSAKEGRDGFKLGLSADVTDEQLLVFACLGLASFGYRSGASALNKALNVKNNSLTEYSVDDVPVIEKALKDYAKGEDSPVEGGFELEVEVSRHTHGEGSVYQFAQEKKIYFRNAGNDTLAELAEKIGFTGDMGDGKEAPADVLDALKAFIAKM